MDYLPISLFDFRSGGIQRRKYANLQERGPLGAYHPTQRYIDGGCIHCCIST